MAGDCVFCSIVAGTAPAERVYEDDAAVAILDLHPAAAGHVLVLPRRHARDLWHIRREEAAATMAAAFAVARPRQPGPDPPGTAAPTALSPLPRPGAPGTRPDALGAKYPPRRRRTGSPGAPSSPTAR